MQVSLTDIQPFTRHSVVIFGYFDVGHRNHNPLGLRQNRQGERLPHRTPRQFHQVHDETLRRTPNPALRHRLLKSTLRPSQRRQNR